MAEPKKSQPDVPPLFRDGMSLPHAGPELLRALRAAWIPGYTARTWAAVASAISEHDTRYDTGDVDWLVRHAADQVQIDDRFGQETTYLHAHWLEIGANQAMLRSDPELIATFRALAGPAVFETTVAIALIQEYRRILAGGSGNAEYFHSKLARHCAEAGSEAIQALRELTEEYPSAGNELTSALALLGEERARQGDHNAALAARQEVTNRRAETDRTTGTASTVSRDDAALAESQVALANSYTDQGRHREAVDALREATRLYRAVAARNRWYERMLALAQYNLALARESAGNRGQAVAAMRQAASSFRQVLADDYRFADEMDQAERELRRLRLVRLRLAPRRRQ